MLKHSLKDQMRLQYGTVVQYYMYGGWLCPRTSLFLVRRELHSDCLALLQAPHIQEEAQLTLPLDINNYPFYRYVQIYFRVRCASVYSQYYSQPQFYRSGHVCGYYMTCEKKVNVIPLKGWVDQSGTGELEWSEVDLFWKSHVMCTFIALSKITANLLLL